MEIETRLIVNGRWRVNHWIGTNCDYDVVYAATDTLRRCAYVVIKFAQSATPQQFQGSRELLRLEYRTLTHLNEVAPNLRVPTVYEYGTYRHTDYLIMSKLGTSIGDWLEERNQRVSNRTILFIFKKVFEIVRAIHGMGISHGDISLNNIVFGRRKGDGLYLAGFGYSGSSSSGGKLEDMVDFCDCMVRVFRENEGGLIPEHLQGIINYYAVKRDEKQMLHTNLEKAYRSRARQGKPIPTAVRAVVWAVVGKTEVDYSEFDSLLSRSLRDAGG